jgi:hypothetical protein
VHSGFVPKMQDLDRCRFWQNSVVHMQRRMLKASDTWITAHRRAQMREVFQQINVIEKTICESLSRPWVIPPGPVHDLFQIS